MATRQASICAAVIQPFSSTFNPNKDSLSSAFKNLLLLYDTWGRTQRDALTGEQAMSTEWELEVPLSALLQYAGWNGDGVALFVARGQQLQKINALQSEYCSKEKAAKRLLEALLASANIGTFREMLLETRNIAVTSRIIPNRALQAKEQRLVDKNIARDTLKSKLLFDLSRCSFCSTVLPNPKTCPCKTVRYCNQDCQRAHWKDHKQTCPHGKSKN